MASVAFAIDYIYSKLNTSFPRVPDYYLTPYSVLNYYLHKINAHVIIIICKLSNTLYYDKTHPMATPNLASTNCQYSFTKPVIPINALHVAKHIQRNTFVWWKSASIPMSMAETAKMLSKTGPATN